MKLSGAFTHELGGAPDEAAHFMTGLMIHDYVVAGINTSPLEFAKEYYRHYPKVAFGVWPPLFHAIEGAWMLLVSPSKFSVLLLLSVLSALLAYFLFREVERHFGFTAGICAGLLLVSVPLMQQSTHLVMVDSSVALFSFLAIIRFGRYLETDDWKDAAYFGIWASAAIMAKYNGVTLAFVPPICAALTGRWNVMWRRSSLLAAGIVLIICGSWYIPMRHLVMYAAEPLPGLATILPAMKANFAVLAGSMGIFVFLVAGCGILFKLSGQWKANCKDQGIWIAAAALLVSCWFFHSISVPEPDPRYMVTGLAPLILFVTAGIYGLSNMLHRPPAQLAVALGIVYAAGSFTITRTPHLGYAELASSITQPRHSQMIILADGDAECEGMSVSEIAIRDRRPSSYVLRGSKILARSTWVGQNYRSLYQTPSGVLRALDAVGASVVIVQTKTVVRRAHNDLLQEALHSATETWQRWSDGSWDQNPDLVVYRRTRPIEGPFCFDVSLDETMHSNLPICIPEQPEVAQEPKSFPSLMVAFLKNFFL